NNMAVLGFATGTPGTIALTAGEHPAVLETCRFLEGKGWRLAFLPVDGEGLLVLPGKSDSHSTTPPLPPLTKGGSTEGPRTKGADDDLRLVTVILAHNETGVIQDLGPLAEACRERGGAAPCRCGAGGGEDSCSFSR